MLVFNPFTGTFDNVSDPATTTLKGIIRLAGDLGGTALSPLVLKLNGVTISGTPSSGNTLVASGGTTAAWQAFPTQRTMAYYYG